MKRFLKVIGCTQQLQVQENMVEFEKALGAVNMIKDQIQYRSQSLLNLTRGYFSTTRGYMVEAIGLFFYSNRDCNPEIVIMADSADQLQ